MTGDHIEVDPEIAKPFAYRDDGGPPARDPTPEELARLAQRKKTERLQSVRRCERVRSCDRSIDGLRQRAADEEAAYEAFVQLGGVLLRDRVGAERVGSLLLDAAMGKVPLRATNTRKAFMRFVS